MSLAYAAVVGPGPSLSACVPWTDVSQWVKQVATQRGASTELDDVQAGTCNLTLDNEAGNFTPGRSYTNNLFPDNIATGTDTLGTTAGFYARGGTTLVSYTGSAYAGANALKGTIPAGTATGVFLVLTDWVPVTAGRTLKVSGALRNTVTSGYPTLTLGLSVEFVSDTSTLANTSWSEADVTMAVGDGWHNLSWSTPVPSTAAFARFTILTRAAVATTGIFFADAFSFTQSTLLSASQVTEGVPVRVGAVQGGNMLPYQIANVDHWNDQTTGDLESVGYWSPNGAYTNSTRTNNLTTTFSYNSSLSGLQFGHSSTAGGNGSQAYIVNDQRSRITYLPPGTYTLRYVLQGISYGAGAVANTVVNILNYASAKASPTLVTTNTTATTLATSAQTVTATVTVPTSAAGLTGLEVVVSLPLASSTVSTVVVSQFQLLTGTAVTAFTPGDCYLPLFAGWADSWTTTTMGGAGFSTVEVDCTDAFRDLGNLSIGLAYESIVMNDPHTTSYWTCNDAASTTLTTVADSGIMNQAMTLVKSTDSLSASFGLTAGAASIVSAASGAYSPTRTGVRPNFQGGGQSTSTAAVSGTSFSWAQGSTGNCGAAANQAQYPQTSRLNAAFPAVGTAAVGSFDCWFTLPALTSGTVALVGNANNTSTSVAGFVVTFNASSGGQLTVSFNGNALTYASVAVWDTNAHYFALTWSVTTGGSLTWNVYIDGSYVGTNTVTYTKPSGSNTIGANQVAGGTVFSQLWQGRISDISLTDTNTPNISGRYSMGTAGYTANENGRIKMLLDAGCADMFSDGLDAPVASSQFPAYSSGAVLTDALKGAATECGGRFFLGRCGGALYNSINHAPVRRVFKDSAGTSADDGLQFAIDGDHLINFAMITTSDGTQYWAVDRTSIDTRGAFPYTLTASYPANSIAQTIANTLVQYHSQPITRVSNVTFSCVNSAMAVQALGLDVGSRVTLADLPDSAPAASSNWIVQSVAVTGVIDGEGGTVPVVAVELSPDLAA